MLTGQANIFTAPEFSVQVDSPNHLRHILGHLTFVLGAGTLLGGLMGCLLLLLLRKIVPPPPVRLNRFAFTFSDRIFTTDTFQIRTM